jgi:RNA polymerase sigma-70 factor (ECF subfamily)
VSREFAALKPRERALLWLAYVEGESHEDIAHALGLSRGSIKVLLSRARGRLRDQLVARGLTARA